MRIVGRGDIGRIKRLTEYGIFGIGRCGVSNGHSKIVWRKGGQDFSSVSRINHDF